MARQAEEINRTKESKKRLHILFPTRFRQERKEEGRMEQAGTHKPTDDGKSS